MKKDEELKIQLDGKPPKSIKFSAVTPISKHSVKEMSTEDFITLAQSQGNSIQSWSETTQYGDEEKAIMTRLLKEAVKVIEKSNSVLKFLLDRMQKNSSKLVICNMDQKLGYGVVTLDVISKGDPVAIYTGPVKIDGFGSNYAYTINSHDSSVHVFCDPEKDGNISRFFQHAFTEANAAKFYEQYGNVDGPFATANVELSRILFDGKIYLMFFAKRQIEKNEMIFCDYGPNYWIIKNLRPQVFNKFGLSLEFKNPQYMLRILGGKIVEKGMSLVSETKKIGSPVSLEDIKELKVITLEMPTHPDLKFAVPTSALRENLILNPNSLTLYFRDPSPFKYHPRYQEYILAVLKHQTGMEWKYNAKNVAVYREFNNTVFNYLKSQGFKIQAGKR